jgi:hypothetical protein
MKVCYAILNYGRALEAVQNIVDTVDRENCIISTNKASRVKSKIKGVKVLNCKDKTVAKAKNEILTLAKKDGYDFVFIIEDDCVVKDSSVYQEYIDTMEKFNLGYINYGFGRETNVIFGIPNPAVVLDSQHYAKCYVFNRMPYSMLACFDLNKNEELFDESYSMIELKEYMVRLQEKGIIPFLGFYMDIPNSHEKIEHYDYKRIRLSDIRMMAFEQQKMEAAGISYDPEASVDKLVEWVKDKI